MKINFNNDNSLLFSSTNVPDVFFTDNIQNLSSDSVKVYLYLLYYAKHDDNIELDSISKNINLPITQIQNAFSELEETNLIVKPPNGYTITNLPEQHLNKIYAPKVTSSVDDINKLFILGIVVDIVKVPFPTYIDLYLIVVSRSG